MNRSFCFGICLALCVVGLSARADGQAQGASYPSRPIKLIVGVSPGSGSDVVARIIGQKLGELLGQSLVIDNRSGAAGTIATTAGARAPADGYTLTLATTSTLITAPALAADARYDAERDFVPVATVARTPFVLVVGAKPGMPTTLAELVAAIRARPHSFASDGSGTIGHLASEMLLKRVGVTAQHVPYRGSVQALSDVAGGQLTFASDVVAAALPWLRDGKIRALAVSSHSRIDALPDVPTFSESGVPGLDQFTLYAWWVLLAPAGTPTDIVSRLSRATATALESDDVKAKLKALELEPLILPPPALATFLHGEIPFWQDFIKESGFGTK
jgi:tripartite-type tricarboxylate transporter receptor subunit TctC